MFRFFTCYAQIITQYNTLGVVGVVGVLVADATNFEGPKVPNFIEKPPFLFASEQNRMSTLSVQKLWAKKQLIILRNSAKHIWLHWPSSEVPEKQKPGKRSCVIVLDTPLQIHVFSGHAVRTFLAHFVWIRHRCVVSLQWIQTLNTTLTLRNMQLRKTPY